MKNATTATTIILLTLIAASVHSQDKREIVVTRANGTTVRVSQATVQVWSSDGYLAGGRFQLFYRFGITDAVTPPAGVVLKPRDVRWADVKKIEWSKPGPDRERVERLTYNGGRVESGFLWRPMRESTFARLYSCQLRIEGKLAIGGTQQDVVISEPEARGEGCSGTPITAIEFTK